MKSIFLFMCAVAVLNAFGFQTSNAQNNDSSNQKTVVKRNKSKMKPKVRFINPAGLAKPPGYTHVVEVKIGRTIYIAGQIALDSSGNIVGRGDFRAQSEQVFANLKTALESSGASFSDVIKLNMYITYLSRNWRLCAKCATNM